MGKGAKIGVGVGLAALAAAGAYFLYGKNGAKNRKQVKSWALKIKGEVLEKLESLKEVNEEKYHTIVDQATDRYHRLKKVSGPEIKKINRDLKGAWGKIQKELV